MFENQNKHSLELLDIFQSLNKNIIEQLYHNNQQPPSFHFVSTKKCIDNTIIISPHRPLSSRIQKTAHAIHCDIADIL